MFSPRKTHKAKHSSLFILYTFRLAPPTYVSLSHSSLHVPVVSHSSLYHSLSDSEAVASSVVFESFYWTDFRITGGTFFVIRPQVACLTSKVHGTVQGRNAPQLNGEDHHLVSQKKVGHDTKETSMPTQLFTRHL
ncbi:hypothetical protein SO802_024699 [Lithocarpus litseifolius]|uniref:Uncharacterized protein n=1 Tax=Lithocarpus litseifolius TaxID=425828 RepID=A0AAW2C9J8_9ROSI